MSIKLKDKEKELLKEQIQEFFREERGEEIGVIASEAVLDFFMENLGDKIYNKALDDSRIWFTERLQDIEIDYDLLYQQ